MITIRECLKSEGQELTELAVKTFFEAFCDSVRADALNLYNSEFREKNIAKKWLENNKTKVWIAEDKNEFLGYLTLTPPDLPIDTTEHDLEIKKIYLLPKAQYLGAGKKLLEKAIQFASTTKCPRILLGVSCENEKAINFYLRNRFKKIGERKFQVGDELHDDFIYELKI